jgi:hypothetical protein
MCMNSTNEYKFNRTYTYVRYSHSEFVNKRVHDGA